MSTGARSGRGRAHAALSAVSRAHLLDLLRSSERPRTAAELADACGLHVNTVRFHLDVLAKSGLVAHEADHSGRRGRPRMVYTATRQHDDTDYRMLAGALAEHWAGTPAERAQRAEQAGYSIVTTSRAGSPPKVGATLPEAVHEVAAVFDRMGFRPEIIDGEAGEQVRLRHCPFRAIAAEYPEVVCSMHLGMVKRILDELRAPAATTRLEPFVEPDLCLVHIGAGTPGSETTSSATRKRDTDGRADQPPSTPRA